MNTNQEKLIDELARNQEVIKSLRKWMGLDTRRYCCPFLPCFFPNISPEEMEIIILNNVYNVCKKYCVGLFPKSNPSSDPDCPCCRVEDDEVGDMVERVIDRSLILERLELVKNAKGETA